MKRYQVNLFYGYEEGEDGIYHSFQAEDPDVLSDTDWIESHLADLLDSKPEDPGFNWNCMYIDLPESVVMKIRKDAVRDYLSRNAKTFFAETSWNREDIEKAIEDQGYEASPEKIEEIWSEMVNGGGDKVVERMCEAGWDAIYDAVLRRIAEDGGAGWEAMKNE